MWDDDRRGLQHILSERQAKDDMTRDEAIRFLGERAVDVIARGSETQRFEVRGAVRLHVEHDGARVVLVHRPGSNAWMLTGFELESDEQGAGYDATPSTQAASTRTRRDLGADGPIVGGARTGDNAPMASRPIAAITERLGEAFKTQRTFNRWWHGTVGTQYHKVQVEADFRHVYERAQAYIDDMARYANEAGDQAPDLLPKLETLSDAVAGLFSIDADKRDAEAIANEPLMRSGQYTVDVCVADSDGQLVRDTAGEELRQFFGMSETQGEANEAAAALAKEYPGATVKQGVLSEDGFALFKGVTPETMEVFAQALGHD